MREIYSVLLSSALSAGCGSATTTETKMPAASPEPVETVSLVDLATETYLKVNALPGNTFPYLPLPGSTFDYGKFEWKVSAEDNNLLYITTHKLAPIMMPLLDYGPDGKIDSVQECLFIDDNDDGKADELRCTKPELPILHGITPLGRSAQVMYEKLLRDTLPAMHGKKVTADKEFSDAYAAALPEKVRELLSEAEEEAWGDPRHLYH